MASEPMKVRSLVRSEAHLAVVWHTRKPLRNVSLGEHLNYARPAITWVRGAPVAASITTRRRLSPIWTRR